MEVLSHNQNSANQLHFSNCNQPKCLCLNCSKRKNSKQEDFCKEQTNNLKSEAQRNQQQNGKLEIADLVKSLSQKKKKSKHKQGDNFKQNRQKQENAKKKNLKHFKKISGELEDEDNQLEQEKINKQKNFYIQQFQLEIQKGSNQQSSHSQSKTQSQTQCKSNFNRQESLLNIVPGTFKTIGDSKSLKRKGEKSEEMIQKIEGMLKELTNMMDKLEEEEQE